MEFKTWSPEVRGGEAEMLEDELGDFIHQDDVYDLLSELSSTKRCYRVVVSCWIISFILVIILCLKLFI